MITIVRCWFEKMNELGVDRVWRGKGKEQARMTKRDEVRTSTIIAEVRCTFYYHTVHVL